MKKIDKKIEAIFYKHCSGVQIDIMAIGHVFAAGRAAVAAGADDAQLTKAIVDFVQTIRKN